jgi:hypothetical protein
MGPVKINKTFRKKLNRFFRGATALLTALVFLSQSTVAYAGVFSNRANTEPCPYLMSNDAPQQCQGSPARAACEAMSALDTGVDYATSGAIIYGATAVVCGVACGYKPAEGACTALFMGAGIVDTILTQILRAQASQYEATARKGHEEAYAIADASKYTSTATPMLSQLITSMVGSGGGGGGGASASSSTNTSDSNNSAQSCAYMAIAVLLAGLKVTNAVLFANGAEDEKKKITPGTSEFLLDTPVEITMPDGTVLKQSTDDNGCVLPFPDTGSGSSLGGAAQHLTDNSGSTASGFGNAKFNRAAANGRVDLSNFDVRTVDSAASSSGNLGLSINHDRLADAGPLVKDRTGASISDIASAIGNGAHPSDVLGSLVPSMKNAAQAIKQNQDALVQELGIDQSSFAQISQKNSDIYGNVGSSSGGGKKAGGMPDFNALLAGLMNKGKGGGPHKEPPGVRDVKFASIAESRKPSGDTFHSDSSKNIFEIVSRRWAVVTWRFMEEDRQNGASQAGGRGVASGSK